MKRLLLKAKRSALENLKNRFERSTKDLIRTQKNLLVDKVRLKQDSLYGRAHRFRSIRSLADFRRSVPLNTYEDIRPYIERLKGGDTSALLGRGERLLMFALTSGSSGEPKYIPITDTFLKEYLRGWTLWSAFVWEEFPEIIYKKVLSIVSPADEAILDSQVRCGAITGLTHQSQNPLVRGIYAVPSSVYKIKDTEVKYYVIMRLAMEMDVGSIVSANPQTLINIARQADAQREDLIRDIYDGTIKYNVDLDLKVRPNPQRAGALERLAERKSRLYPMDYWPGLMLLCCWKGGTLSQYLERLPQYYGDVSVRDVGLIASEGRMSIPISNEGSAGILDIMNNFYEFIPEGDEDSATPDVLLSNEVKRGANYFVVLSTSSGFFRYKIMDLIRVVDHYNQTPIIEFLNKGRHISSIAGEKLTEHQVVEAARHVARQMGLELKAFMLVPSNSHSAQAPHYTFIVEESDFPSESASSNFLAEFDRQLCRLNLEYDSRRGSNRLDSPRIKVLRDGSFDMLRRRHIERACGRGEQYKHRFLVPEADFQNDFGVVEKNGVSSIFGKMGPFLFSHEKRMSGK